MRDFRYPHLWFGIWVFGWLLCITLSLIRPPDLGLEVQQGDKIGHFLAYGLLSAWAVWIYEHRRRHWIAAAALIALGLLLEAAQGMLTEHRLMDSRDAIANTVGVLSGQVMAWTRWRNLLQGVERSVLRG